MARGGMGAGRGLPGPRACRLSGVDQPYSRTTEYWSVCLLILLSACSSTGEELEQPGPVIIAHRGASGYLPEHTLKAYALGHAMGADLIEPDLVMSGDGHLVCSHDRTLRRTSNAAALYPHLANESGEVRFCDLTLAEIGRVEFPGKGGEGSYRYVTFAEFLDLMKRLGRSTGQQVGIIPELKAPGWHRSLGLPMEAELLDRLVEAGYGELGAPVIIQCFEKESLRRLRVEHGSPFRQVLCLGKDSTGEDLDWAARFCDGIAPSRAGVEDAETGAVSDLVARAHALGLAVYPYTFKDEQEAMARFLHEHRVEGLFTDFPDKGAAARDGP